MQTLRFPIKINDARTISSFTFLNNPRLFETEGFLCNLIYDVTSRCNKYLENRIFRQTVAQAFRSTEHFAIKYVHRIESIIHTYSIVRYISSDIIEYTAREVRMFDALPVFYAYVLIFSCYFSFSTAHCRICLFFFFFFF